MGLNINLRGDLAKLSDAELAERLEHAWRRYESADKHQRSSSMFWKRRTTAELPLRYRIWAGFHRSPGFRVLDWTLRALLSSYTNYMIERPVLVSKSAIQVDDHIGDIQTVMSEIKRRLDERESLDDGHS
jgi:hypothetical protein